MLPAVAIVVSIAVGFAVGGASNVALGWIAAIGFLAFSGVLIETFVRIFLLPLRPYAFRALGPNAREYYRAWAMWTAKQGRRMEHEEPPFHSYRYWRRNGRRLGVAAEDFLMPVRYRGQARFVPLLSSGLDVRGEGELALDYKGPVFDSPEVSVRFAWTDLQHWSRTKGEDGVLFEFKPGHGPMGGIHVADADLIDRVLADVVAAGVPEFASPKRPRRSGQPVA